MDIIIHAMSEPMTSGSHVFEGRALVSGVGVEHVKYKKEQQGEEHEPELRPYVEKER